MARKALLPTPARLDACAGLTLAEGGRLARRYAPLPAAKAKKKETRQ